MPPPYDYPLRSRQVALAIIADMNATIAVESEDGSQDIDPPRFVADFVSVPDFKVPDLKDLRVSARDIAWTPDVESRGGRQDHYQVEIAVQKTVSRGEEDDIATLKDLTARIARRYCPKFQLLANLAQEIEANTVQVILTVPLIYSPEKLAQNRYFGTVNLTLQEFTDR